MSTPPLELNAEQQIRETSLVFALDYYRHVAHGGVHPVPAAVAVVTTADTFYKYLNDGSVPFPEDTNG